MASTDREKDGRMEKPVRLKKEWYLVVSDAPVNELAFLTWSRLPYPSHMASFGRIHNGTDDLLF